MSEQPIDPFALTGVVLDGQYRVDAVVGEGGFGVVYKGWHLSFEQPIAIKALKVPQAYDAETQASVLSKFREEAKYYYVLSQASLNIVRSIGFGAAEMPSGVWAPYMVLEWLEGRSLAEDLADRRRRGLKGRTLAETIELLEPAARGLAYAHSKRVAHRDVKPGNLFLTTLAGDPPEPTVKVLDFGIAKVIAEGATAGSAPTKATAFSSFTPFYAAPEQFDMRLGVTGPWTDVYAFALVLTEVLSDQQAIEEEDALKIIARATDPVTRPSPRAHRVEVSDAVESVFLKALAVDPRERFHDVGEMWEALSTAARATAPSQSVQKLPTKTARMQSRPALETAPMASVPGAPPRPSHVTAPMRAVTSQPPAPSAPLAIATPPPMAIATPSPGSAPATWTAPSATPWSQQAGPGGWTAQGPPPSPRGGAPPAAMAPTSSSRSQGLRGSTVALGCVVAIVVAAAGAVLLGVYLAGLWLK